MRRSILVAVVAVAAGLSSTVMASTVDVTPSNMGNWTFYSTDSSGTLGTGSNTGQMVVGPAGQPLGTGSANFIVTGTGSEQLRNTDWADTRIADLTSLSFSTYAATWNGQQVPYLTLYVSTTGSGLPTDRLIFEPDYSFPAQPHTAQNTWQTWNALSGKWYTQNGLPANGPGSNTITLTQYLSLFPNATIENNLTSGGVRFNSGFASTNFNTNLDNFTIGTAARNVTYNFDPDPVPTPLPSAAGMGLVVLGVIGGTHVVRKKLRSATE